MDKTMKAPAYLLGRLVALVENECKDMEGFPFNYSELCMPGTANQAYGYWVNQALQKTMNKDLTDLASMGLKTTIEDERGQYYVGYYHQKAWKD